MKHGVQQERGTNTGGGDHEACFAILILGAIGDFVDRRKLISSL